MTATLWGGPYDGVPFNHPGDAAEIVLPDRREIEAAPVTGGRPLVRYRRDPNNPDVFRYVAAPSD